MKIIGARKLRGCCRFGLAKFSIVFCLGLLGMLSVFSTSKHDGNCWWKMMEEEGRIVGESRLEIELRGEA